MSGYTDVKALMELTGASKSKAYAVIAKLNAELAEQGYIVFSGKCPTEYVYSRLGLNKKCAF